jgi:hypothetical protein
MVPILVLTLAVVGCGAISNVRSQALPGRLCLQVADAETMIPLEGVSISAINRDGEVPLGTTDEHGAVCVPKRTLASYDPSLILFCRQGFFCGALKTREDMSGHDFLDFDEHFITLARFKIG